MDCKCVLSIDPLIEFHRSLYFQLNKLLSSMLLDAEVRLEEEHRACRSHSLRFVHQSSAERMPSVWYESHSFGTWVLFRFPCAVFQELDTLNSTAADFVVFIFLTEWQKSRFIANLCIPRFSMMLVSYTPKHMHSRVCFSLLSVLLLLHSIGVSHTGNWNSRIQITWTYSLY